jgi:hypothetical protein
MIQAMCLRPEILRALLNLFNDCLGVRYGRAYSVLRSAHADPHVAEAG